MSRNSNRFSKPPAPAAPQPDLTQQEHLQNDFSNNPFGVSFVVPTEIVYLPSRGKYYDNESPLYGIKTVEIKAMTSREEDILVNESFIKEGVVFERLLDSLIVTPNIKVSQLLDCDQAALLAAARKTGYGDTLEIDLVCSDCGNGTITKVQISDFLNRIQETSTEEDQVILENVTKMENGFLKFTLPVTSLTVIIKTMTPEDFDFLRQAKEQKEKLKLPFSETIEFLRRVLIEVNGVTSKIDINQLVEVLPPKDARYVKRVHLNYSPRFDTSCNFQCSHCSRESVQEVPFSVGWFWWD